MPLVHRVLFTWLFTMSFLVLAVLKLDNRVSWNWFLVFVPLWIFDTALLVMLAVRIVSHCRTGHDQADVTLRKKAWYLLAVLLKLAFLLAVCAWLQSAPAAAPLYFLFVPLWLLLLGAAADLGHHVFWVLV
ncbi:transmembrane protein 60 [Petromyzon marinus]|nr:transmembrane protein 60 [Petromyzon marinus]